MTNLDPSKTVKLVNTLVVNDTLIVSLMEYKALFGPRIIEE